MLFDSPSRKVFGSYNSSQGDGARLYDNLVASAAEQPPLRMSEPTPIYASQLPSYLFEGERPPVKRLLRARSTSWSTPYDSYLELMLAEFVLLVLITLQSDYCPLRLKGKLQIYRKFSKSKKRHKKFAT